MSLPSNILISTVLRNQRNRGPTSSAQQNDLQAELIRDLSEYSRQWNTFIVPIFKLLPDGSEDPLVNAITDGLDGRTLFVHSEATLTTDSGQYFQSTRNRPNTLYEQFQDVYATITEQFNSLESAIEDTGGTGITAAQKIAIGANIFDGTATSSASSIDGRSQANLSNILQVSRDLYGSAYASFTGDGDALLSYSLRDMVGALLTLHAGTWNSDVTLAHAFTAADITSGTMSQERLEPSSTSGTGISDTYSGSPTHLVHDLNLIRTQIRNLKNAASAWTTALTLNANWNALTAGLRPTDVKLLTDLKGSANRTDTNPWGYSYTNIDGLSTIHQAIIDYIGSPSIVDDTPTYSGVLGFNQGDDLTTAIGNLAVVVSNLDSSGTGLGATISGHIANTSNPHSTTLTQVATAGGVAPASQITIVDDSLHYAGTTVEQALDEVMDNLVAASGLLTGLITTLETDTNNAIDNLEPSTSFRRLEVQFGSLLDDASVLVEHDAGMYPQVSVIAMDNLTEWDAGNVLPINTVSGIQILHSGVNDLYIINRFGETISSGLAILNW